jgi:hypothetical protein
MRSLLLRAFVAVVLANGAVGASAGPPFLTDDPEPTDTRHWELYTPQFQAAGIGGDLSGSFGAEINYGPVRNVQLTLDVPIAFSHEGAGWRSGAGNLAASIKYRFYHNERAGLQIAVFPGITLPTAANGLGAGRVTAFLPIWAQKDIGPWSVFGGGGYNVNPGAGNRNYWSGGVAVARQFGKKLLVGVEADQYGSDVTGGHSSTSVGVGTIVYLGGPMSLLGSAGPTWTGNKTGYHVYAALGLNF